MPRINKKLKGGNEYNLDSLMDLLNKTCNAYQSISITIPPNNINKALKQFKVKFKKTQVLKEVRERKNYIKPSLKRKVNKEEAIRKFKKQRSFSCW